MGEEIPRRMMRFYRNKPTEGQVREKSSEIAMSKVDSFREQHSRYPNRDELDEISQSVFEQLRKELKREETEMEEIDLGPEKGAAKATGEKTILERRKEQREAEKKGKGKAQKEEAKPPQGPEPSRSEMRRQEKQNAQQAKGGASQAEDSEGEVGQGEELDQGLPGSLQEGADAGQTLKELEEIEAELNREGVKKLAEIDELSKLEGELEGEGGGEFDLVEKEFDADGASCPKCSSKAEEIIYCPSCGEAFCDHCAKKVEVLADSVKYTCGVCRAEFKKKKPVK